MLATNTCSYSSEIGRLAGEGSAIGLVHSQLLGLSHRSNILDLHGKEKGVREGDQLGDSG